MHRTHPRSGNIVLLDTSTHGWNTRAGISHWIRNTGQARPLGHPNGRPQPLPTACDARTLGALDPWRSLLLCARRSHAASPQSTSDGSRPGVESTDGPLPDSTGLFARRVSAAGCRSKAIENHRSLSCPEFVRKKMRLLRFQSLHVCAPTPTHLPQTLHTVERQMRTVGRCVCQSKIE